MPLLDASASSLQRLPALPQLPNRCPYCYSSLPL